MKKRFPVSAKHFNRVLGLMIALVLVVAPLSVFAEEAPNWQVEKSKTATPLDLNNQTTVTLGLPATENEISNAEIVFVLDESYLQEYTDNAITLLDNLIATENLKVKVGVVKFDAWAHDAYSLAVNGSEDQTGLVDLNATNQDNIKKALTYRLREDGNKRLGGSNTEMPLRMAQEMLDNGDTNADKYIVFCSDLRAYVWEGQVTIDGETYTVPASRIGNSVEHQGNLSHQPLYNSFDQLIAAYTDGTITGRADYNQDSFFRWGTGGASWNTYWEKIYQGTVPFSTTLTAAEYGAYEDTWQQSVTPKLYGFDKSLGLTYDAFNASIAKGTNFMLITDFQPQAGPMGYNAWVDLILPDFIQYIADEGADVYELANGDTVAGAMTDFDTTITSKIVKYKVASGSLTDEIGDKFDLVVSGSTPFSLKVGGTELPSTATGENQWSFGSKDAETNVYPYVVTYTPGANEAFTWQIHAPVEKDLAVQLSYVLQLNDTTQSAVYPTNKSAVLQYTDSLGATGEEVFPIPTVEYIKLPVHVKYDPDGGNLATDETGLREGTAGTDIEKPTDPKRDGYVFAGWFTGKDGSGQQASSTFPATDIVYYAKWIPAEKPVSPDTGDSADLAGLMVLLSVSTVGLAIVAKRIKHELSEH